MKSVMKHQFSQVPKAEIPRSSFNRNHGYKTTFDSGYLVPFYVDEALPGDTFNLNANIFTRMATPIVPIMDNLVMDTFFFAVPLRLVWENFQRFMGEQDNPDDSTDFLIPQLIQPTGGWTTGSLEDYFGLPLDTEFQTVSALWHRAYNLIFNDWFRDENLQDSVPVPTDDGPDPDTNYTLLRRGKRHDYFTSCLPWPQKGPGVLLPLGDSAPIQYTAPTGGAVGSVVYDTGTGLPFAGTANNLQTDSTGQLANTAGSTLYDIDNSDSLSADLSSATAATINSLRQAFQMQRLLERDARSGTRYTEVLKAHFGVTSPDFRLQRPEYLGGGSIPIQVNPVAQTNATGSDVQQQDTPQGNLAAYAVGAGTKNGFSKSFVEHSVIIGLVNVRADLTYQRGLPRMFSRSTKYDFYWPALAHLGEQSVLNKEIFAQGTAPDNEVFGYQERWAEYRYYPSKITGKFRSTDPQSLDIWHLSQDFQTLPTLSAAFIEDNPPVDRVIAVPSEPEFIFDSYIECRTARPMPVYSVPGMIDHF